MNILIEGGDLNPPFAEGTRNIVITYAKALVRRGHKVAILTRQISRLDKKKLRKYEVIEGIKFYRWSNYLNLIRNYKKIIEKENIEIVHFFAKGTRPRIYFRVLKKIKNRPFIFNLLGLPSYSIEEKSIKKIIRSLKEIDLTVITSKSIFGELKENIHATYLPFGIDLNRFRITNMNRNIVLCLRKPDSPVVHAFERLSKEFTEIKFKFNSATLDQESEKLIREKFATIGKTEDMPKIYNQTKILLDLHDKKRHLECASPPAAILEASACGATIISTKMPEIEEIIKDKSNGFLIENTEEEIYTKIRHVLRNYKINKQLARKMREFDINQVIKKYEKVYEEFL